MRGRRNRSRPRASSGRVVAVFGFDPVHALTVAPSGWRSIAITWACLLFSRVRGALAPFFRSASAAVSAAWTAGASACGGESQRVVALVRHVSFQTLEDDQGALAEAVEHLFACAAFDVVGNHSILPLVCWMA